MSGKIASWAKYVKIALVTPTNVHMWRSIRIIYSIHFHVEQIKYKNIFEFSCQKINRRYFLAHYWTYLARSLRSFEVIEVIYGLEAIEVI